MFLINYGPGKNADKDSYNRLDAGVKALGNCSSRIPTTSLLEAPRLNATNIRDRLKQFLDDENGDQLFVARISKNWAGRNMGNGFPEWLKRREFGAFAAAPASEECLKVRAIKTEYGGL